MTPEERARIQALLARLKDRLNDIEIGLFNALIASDAMFIGAASVLIAIKPNAPKWLMFTIIGCCSASMLLLVRNFQTMRGVYRDLLRTIDEAAGEKTAPNPNAPAYIHQANEAADAYANNAIRERICYFLPLETLIIFGVVVAAY